MRSIVYVIVGVVFALLLFGPVSAIMLYKANRSANAAPTQTSNRLVVVDYGLGVVDHRGEFHDMFIVKDSKTGKEYFVVVGATVTEMDCNDECLEGK